MKKSNVGNEGKQKELKNDLKTTFLTDEKETKDKELTRNKRQRLVKMMMRRINKRTKKLQ